jgi:hypothetical protein
MRFSGKLTGLVILMATQMASSSVASAGAKIEADETKWLSIGVGVRASFKAVEDAAPSGDDWSSDFNLDSARIYLNGQIHKYVKFELNTECVFCGNSALEDYDILDAIAKFEFSPAFNIWAGRMLVPSDRAEMSGPYYANTYDFNKTPFYPSDQSVTHNSGGAGVYGRDEGATIWGALGQGGKFTYALGIFDGLEGGSSSNEDDNLLYAARLSYNFLNVEKNPGYYTSSTYYGGAGDIFTVALAMQHQADGTGTAADPGDFRGYSIDALYETTLGNGGVATVEAEYKDFDTDSKTGGLGLFEGDAWTATALYMFPTEMGIGKVQPYIRYTDVSPELGADSDELDVGFNYIISGHNARISVMYQTGDLATGGGSDVDAFKIGLQYQY